MTYNNKWALLIGINKYQNLSLQFQLKGCINDIDMMAGILEENFGFQKGNIMRLQDEAATRDRILAAFKRLSSRIMDNDIVVVHYCGHGSQMRDREGDEPDGWDETIVPYDSGRSPYPNRDITDDEIYMWLLELTGKTTNVTLIFDCCHSGTIARDAFGTKSRWVEPDRRSIPELPPSPIAAGITKGFKWDSGPSGWLPLSSKYVLIAGCRDDESSYEHNITQDGFVFSHGAFTYFLGSELVNARTGTTYRDVFERASAQVTAFHPRQHPQMEGARDRELFGSSDIKPIPFVSVIQRSGDKVTLGAGAAHGMTVRSRWGVYPQSLKQIAKDSHRTGSVEITNVHAVASDARIIEETQNGIIEAGQRAVEEEHSYGDMKLRIEIQAPDEYARELNDLKQCIKNSKLLDLVENGEFADVCVYVIAPRIDAKINDQVPQLGIVERPTWAVVGQDGKLIMPLHAVDETDAASILCDNLEKFTRYNQVLILKNPNRESLLKGKVDFILKRRKTDGTWVLAQPDNASGYIIFEEGERIAFEIINRYDSPVYVSILDLGLTGAVDLLYPIAGANERLSPGRSIHIGVREGDVLELFIPPNYPYLSDPSDEISFGGIEIFKLIVTTQEADFSFFSSSGFRNITKNIQTPMHLLEMAFMGNGSRDVIKNRLSPDNEWSTIERSILLQRNTIVSGKTEDIEDVSLDRKLPENSRSIKIQEPETQRFIQAQVFEARQGDMRTLKSAFVKGTGYGVKVRIGPSDRSWLEAGKEFPEHLLPLKEKNILQVFFSEPNHVPEVQNAHIALTQSGPSTECRFFFRVNKNIPVFHGRIIVAYKNRILQTALLKGEVVESQTEAVKRKSIRLEVEAVVRPASAGLSGRKEFDLAFLVNHGSDNKPRLTKLADDRASIKDIEGIQGSIRNIQEKLENTARNMGNTNISGGGALRSSETEALLNFLAYHGRILYDAIITDQVDAGWLPRHPERIQLVSAHAEAFLPLEFLYEKPVPAPDARLCPGAEEALREGKCQDCLLKNEGVIAPYICPIGFWGLSRVIERHIHDPGYGRMMGSSDFVMQAEPVANRSILHVLRTCLYAASDRVDGVVPGQRQQFMNTLNSVSDNTGMVSMWNDWAREIAAKRPTLLILMPHTIEDEILRAPAMEIGSSDRLASGYIRPGYVCVSPEDQAPIVALLGCETMVPYSKYMGFVPQFRRNGAALVLCTLTTVLGRHVVPIAQKLVEELKSELEGDGSNIVSFGDVLLHVRRNVLLGGLPIVLCLVAFGDADWQLLGR